MDFIIGFLASSFVEIFKPTYANSNMRYKEVSFNYNYNLTKLSRKLEIQADFLIILSVLFSYLIFILFNNIKIAHVMFMIIGAIIDIILIAGLNIVIHYILKETAIAKYKKYGKIEQSDLKNYTRRLFPWYKIIIRTLYTVSFTLVFTLNELIKSQPESIKDIQKWFKYAFVAVVCIVTLKILIDFVLYISLFPTEYNSKNIYLLDRILNNRNIEIKFDDKRTLLIKGEDDVYIDENNNLLIINNKGESTWYTDNFIPYLQIDGKIIEPKSGKEDKN